MRSTAVLLARIGWRNLLSRPLSALLLLAAVSAATTTLGVAISIRSAAGAPWDRTFARSAGPDLVANSESRAALAGLPRAAGVASASGPSPFVRTSATLRARDVMIFFVARTTFVGAVDRPLVTAGVADVAGRGVVLEASTAEALAARVGDVLTVNGEQLPVRGVALSTSGGPFEQTAVGLGWVSPQNAASLAPTGLARGWQIELRLADHHDLAGFLAANIPASVRNARGGVAVTTWIDSRQATLALARPTRIVLLTAALLLAVLAEASAALIVATRMSARSRQLGALKAVGLTVGESVCASALEYLMLAAGATVIGVIGGAALAPVVTHSAVNVLRASSVPSLTLSGAATVGLVAMAVVSIASVVPGFARARRTTVSLLNGDARPPSPATRLAAAAATLKLPLAVIVGVRSTTRRRGRAALATATLALSVAMGVAAIATQHSFDQSRHTGSDIRLRAVVLTCAAVFIALGSINTFAVTLFTVRDGAHNHAILGALGLTPAQSTTALVTSQLVTSFAAVAIGIPLGLAIFRGAYLAASGSTAGSSNPPALWLVVVGAATITAAIALAAFPAAKQARGPKAHYLASG